jgi:hypothetical protein
MSHGHLVGQFLQFQFLKFNKFASPGLQMECIEAASSLLTFGGRTGALGHKFAFALQDLVNFAATSIARIGCDLAIGFDVTGADYHAPDGDETAHAFGTHVAQGNTFGTVHSGFAIIADGFAKVLVQKGSQSPPPSQW